MSPLIDRRILADDHATALLGNDIAAALRPGDVLALVGDLGAGKTALARAIIRSLADDAALDVPSPTFTIVQNYDARLPVAHFDLYRVSSPQELEELGFDEAIAAGAVLVEWPDRAGNLLPMAAATIELTEDGTGRTAAISGGGPLAERMSRSFEIRQFLQRSGRADAWRTHLTGDASTRAYETILAAGEPRRILMNAPRQPDGPPIRDGKPYSQIARLAESVTPFVAVDRALREAGFAAPEIFDVDLDAGLLILENLGSDGILEKDGTPSKARYLAAAELLAAFHAVEWSREHQVSPGIVHRVQDYDREAMLVEISLMLDWYVPAFANKPATDADRERFFCTWNTVLDRLASAETSLVLRDFHSPNLIWRADKDGKNRFGIIDFQDAVIGPAAYDLASLAMDARVTIDPELEHAIFDTYAASREARGDFDRVAFEEAYAIMAAQRNAKILGIFVRLDRRDGKPTYLKHLPRIRSYFNRALAHPSLVPVKDALDHMGLGTLGV